MKKIKLIILVLLIAVMLYVFAPPIAHANDNLIPLVRGTQTIYHYNTSNPVMIPSTYTEQESEFRGVWVATVFSLNMPLHTSESQYKTAFNALITQVKARKMNAIVFQVRPQNDAFYDSEYAPFSRWLTGTEGGDPGWDAMGWMIETAHANGIEFHAWLNPYRVQNSASDKTTMINSLHAENFAKKNPNLVIAGNLSNSLYPYILNPGEPAVKTYIRNVVKELISLYDVDGVHFDDYFYPYSGLNSDSATYNTYKLPDQALADWRRENVNDVIRGVKEDVDLHNTTLNKDVRFGVSPFGIWRSGGEGSNTSTSALQSFSSQFADSRKWVKEGWVHYITPQVYWRFNHSLAPYADVVDWWAETVRGTGVDLLIGHAIYNAHLDGWPDDEITTQFKYNHKHPEIKGSILYSYSYLDKAAMADANATVWTTMPLSTWQSSNVPTPTLSISGTKEGTVYRSNVTVSLTGEETLFYKIGTGDWILYENPILFDQNGTYAIYAKTVNSSDEESLIRGENITIQKINNDVPVIRVEGKMIGDRYVIGSMVFIDATETIFYAVNYGSVGVFGPYTEPFQLTGTGNYFVRSYTVNSEGVLSVESNRLIRVVLDCYSDPQITVTGTGQAPYYQNAVITLQSESPVIQYRLNGGSWQTYGNPFLLDIEGTYLIEFMNQDGCQVLKSHTVHIDKTPPMLPETEVIGDMEGIYYIEPVEVNLSTDNPEDVIYFRIHNGRTWSEWSVYTSPIQLELNATYMIESYAEDLALNESPIGEIIIRLNIPPTEDNPYVVRDGQYVTYYNTDIKVPLPTSYVEKDEEIRAIWVATVSNIDLGLHTSESDYKSRILTLLNTIQANNFNVMFFQVRPMNDAFYPSAYAPFSRFLTGIEGVDPGWDVLAFVIDEAHKRGIEVHAWLNPYRVSSSTDAKNTQLAALHDQNFAKMHPEYVLSDRTGRLILNPGEPAVRTYLQNVIQELLDNYRIDGIHFDDYFYSYNGMDDIQDAATYQVNKLQDQSLADWRRENVNTMVRTVFETVEAHNTMKDKHVKFGISPFGIWRSGGSLGSNTSTSTLQSYSAQFADSKKWVEEGWLHYIMPQLYWEFSHGLAPFADLVDWWAALCTLHDVDLIIGHGFYRYVDNSWKDANEMTEQIRYISQYDIIKGSAFFSYKTLNSTHPMVVQALTRIKDYYWTTQPLVHWETDMFDVIPVVCNTNQTLIDGVCVDNPPVCEPNQTLIDGECVVNPPVPCEEGYERIDGECVLIPEDEPIKRGCFGLWTASTKPRWGSWVFLSIGISSLIAIAFVKKQ